MIFALKINVFQLLNLIIVGCPISWGQPPLYLQFARSDLFEFGWRYTLVTNIRKFTVSRFVIRRNSETQITNNHWIYPLSVQLKFTSLAKESRVFTQCDIFCILRHKFSWCVAPNLVWKYLFIIQASKTTDTYQWISAISMLRKSKANNMTTN